MTKKELIHAIASHLQRELSAIEQAARAAHEAATHDESRAEDSHDTRGLEASYLAGAQAARAAEIQKQIQLIQQLPPKEFGPTDPIGLGACVELKQAGRSAHYFLVAQGGGMQIELSGKKLNLISAISPIGEELLGRKRGDSLEVESQAGLRAYEVVAVS